MSEPLETLSAAVDAAHWTMDADEHEILHRIMTSVLVDEPAITIPQPTDPQLSLDKLGVKSRVAMQWDTVNGQLSKKTGKSANYCNNKW